MPKEREKLRYYSVDCPQGHEGAYPLMGLILQYADSHGWRHIEVQRIVDLKPGESLTIEELTITRSPKT